MSAPILQNQKTENAKARIERVESDNDGVVVVESSDAVDYEADGASVANKEFQVLQLKEDANGDIVPQWDFLRFHTVTP